MDNNGFTVPIEIRFADLDAYGHVNNATYLTFLKNARVKLFERCYNNFLGSALMFLVVRVECDFKRPIEMYDPLFITLTTEKLKHSSFIFNYLFHDGQNRIYAKARTVMACYDPKLGKPVAIPDEMREYFAQFTAVETCDMSIN